MPLTEAAEAAAAEIDNTPESPPEPNRGGFSEPLQEEAPYPLESENTMPVPGQQDEDIARVQSDSDPVLLAPETDSTEPAAAEAPDAADDPESAQASERADQAATENVAFYEGDFVVYPTHGVGKVERIATEEIAGHRLELIHITFEENRMTLRVPVTKARSAGLRKLASRTVFEQALTVLKGRARIKRTMWSRRAQEYEAKINSGDPIAIAEVVRDLHRNAGQPDQSFSERQIYEAALDRLAAELAALDRTDKLAATAKLGEHLKTVEPSKPPPPSEEAAQPSQ